jgi:small subunit ribosomal protein S19e
MATVYDVNPTELIHKTAEQLKTEKLVSPPDWARFAKTGMHKQRQPVNPDWWYVRAAAVLRSVYLMGPIGVSKLRTKYGGKRDRGHKMERFYKGSGSIIRKMLQQLETAGLIKQAARGVHKGRIVTPEGMSILDKAASTIQTDFVSPEIESQLAEPKAKADKKQEKKSQSKTSKPKESETDIKKRSVPPEESVKKRDKESQK